MTESLAAALLSRIARTGPLTVAEYMTEALHRRDAGYYAGGDPLGAAGDFVTAPETSQMFGELLGLWMVAAWRQAGRPAPACLVELGPGRGTLMADMLRAMSGSVAVAEVFEIHLVETNPDLRRIQADTLGAATAQWHDSVATLPDLPCFVVANEFFDSLPIHQLAKAAGVWREVLIVAGDAGDSLAWGLDRAPSPLIRLLPAATRDACEDGAIAEICPTAITLTAALARRIAGRGGAMIIIDYGSARGAAGASLQAVRRHRRVDPLAEPGLADLSSHVDFTAVTDAAAGAGARVFGPVGQGAFLVRLGIRARARRLMRRATPAQRRDIAAALRRLIAPTEMGTLFKVAAVAPDTVPAPAGFADGAGDMVDPEREWGDGDPAGRT